MGYMCIQGSFSYCTSFKGANSIEFLKHIWQINEYGQSRQQFLFQKDFGIAVKISNLPEKILCNQVSISFASDSVW